MVAAGCLPVAWHAGKMYFLFGKEAYNDRAPGYSDFTGGLERGESVYDGALREFAEETTGFFGDVGELDQLIHTNGGCLPLALGERGDYHVHLFRMKMDPVVIECYNRNHAFIYDHVSNHRFLKSTKLFEKIRVDWMTVEEMRRRRREFRPFYRQIVDQLLNEHFREIREFITTRRNINHHIRF